MPSIGLPDQEIIKFHLNYLSEATPAGDRAWLQKQLDANRTPGAINMILAQVRRVERTWNETETDEQSSGVAYRRIITGDTNRSDIEFRPEPSRARWKAYIRELDQLAMTLGVLNYRNPKNEHLLHYGVIPQ